MIVSVGVGIGMQKEIKDKISVFEGDISIQSFNNTINENSIIPITPSKDEILSLISFCIPNPTPTETIITIIPIVIATIPIFIIGADILFLYGIVLKILFDKKCSKFKIQFCFYY